MISCLPDMYPATLAPTNVAAAARFFRVLGDPTRLRILELLGDGPRTVGELIEATHQSQPRVSTHLACLRHCGFVETERRGKQVMYSLTLASLVLISAPLLDRPADRADLTVVRSMGTMPGLP